MPPKQLILLASAFTYRANAFEEAAQRLGIPVVRGTDVPPPMLGKVSIPLAIDYRDLPRSAIQIEQYAREHPIGAIIGLDDSGTLLAAAASELIDLPYNAPEAALAARDKHLMRQKFAAAGVSSPNFHHYHLDADISSIAAQTRFPCVIKPTTLSGSRGVMRADHPVEFLQRVEQLKKILANEPCDEFLVEDFIPGVEVALEGLMDYGTLHVLALFDKPDPLDGPYFEETIYVTPSRLPKKTQKAITQVAGQAAAALGLVTGPIHAELRVDKGKPVMVEVAARSIGGSCSKTLRFDLNTSLEELIIRQAFQYPVSNIQSFDQRLPVAAQDKSPVSASGVMMIPIPYSGLLSRVEGLEAAARIPAITEIEITAGLNRPIHALPEGDSYLGFIFARGETPEAVEAALREAHACLSIEIAPELPLIN